MFGAERRQLILDLVRAKGAASIRDLARATDVSEVTVRRDVTTLVNRGLLERSHGGAMVPGREAGETLVLGESAPRPGATMFGAERRHVIHEFVLAHKVVTLHELTAAVNASEVTVRRDLATLEKRGLITRSHGGAHAPDALVYAPWSDAAPSPAVEAKAAIAALAATLVGDGEAIMLGAGTTVHELARRLAPTSPLTVLTNSMLVARALARTPHVELVMTRGSLDSSSQALVGSAAEQWMAGHRASRAFLSGGGVTTERGLSNGNLALSAVDRAIVGSARDVVVLADHSKLGVEGTYPVAPTGRITHLVTDDASDASVLDGLRAHGVDVHVAPAATG